MELRIGISLGDVIVEADDIYGDGVNVAARLQTLAKPSGIVVSAAVRDNVGTRLDLHFKDMGDQILKNIDRPMHAYSVSLGSSSPFRTGQRRRRVTGAIRDREAFDRGSAVQQHERGSGAGVLQRRDHRGHHHRPVEDLRPVRRRAQHGVQLQGQARRTCSR